MFNPFVNELYHGKQEFQCPSWGSFGKYDFWNVSACMYVDAFFFLLIYVYLYIFIYLQDYDYTAVTFASIPYIVANPLLQFKT